MSNRKVVAIAIVACSAGLLIAWWWRFNTAPRQFNGSLAFRIIEDQMKYGPRPAGSSADRQTGDYIISRAQSIGWHIVPQEFSYKGVSVRNIIAQANTGQGGVIILGAHYDTRLHADRDPVDPTAPVPGANDGASGVAVLLELARVLDLSRIHHEIWLSFFDAEDDGDINGWEWGVGSAYMAQHLTVQPAAMLLVDMVGDSDQQIYFDVNSDRALSQDIFGIAGQLGFAANFIPQPKYAMIDDHTAFAARGIRSVDLIDFDYPSWHQTGDTLDKVSADSLERVGRTLQVYLESLP